MVVVPAPGMGVGREGDALVSRHPRAALAVFTADCAPVALASPEGVIGVAHAGWRGLVAGVLGHTVAAMRALGAGWIEAALGPCIHPGCYDFGAAELEAVVGVAGPGARGRTGGGGLALDLPGAVRGALGAAGVDLVTQVDRCTACSPELFSFRASGDSQRQAAVIWLAQP